MALIRLFTIGIIIKLVLSQISLDELDELRSELRAEFDETRFRDLLTATVRLIFHDCSGPGDFDDDIVVISQCNGCIDLSNPDHAGLESRAVIPLDDIYNISGWNEIMSRADFWATAGTIAIEYAQELDTANPDDKLPPIPYYFGRTDCGDTANADTTKSFPEAKAGWDQTSLWFADNLGLNDKETVAIIGAHTLGRPHTEDSGYSSLPWVTVEDGPDVLNNQFYINLLIENWSQSQSPTGLWEFKDDTDEILMFNADICLAIDIDPYLNETGKVTCPTDGCPESDVVDIVIEYANDNQIWLDDFADVWEKLILSGYDANDLIVIGGTTTTTPPIAGLPTTTEQQVAPSSVTETTTTPPIATTEQPVAPSSVPETTTTTPPIAVLTSNTEQHVTPSSVTETNKLSNQTTATPTNGVDNSKQGDDIWDKLDEHSGIIALVAAIGVVILSIIICCFIICSVCCKNESSGGGGYGSVGESFKTANGGCTYGDK
eukprot:363286_1